jgi:ABC-type polysaccharide/polyol phosphate transport system ATPase subunit
LPTSSDGGGATAIRVERLGKQYTLGVREDRYRTLRDALTTGTTRALGRLRGLRSSSTRADERLWALDDVTLTIPKGRAVGIIGRNGSGKSTLLKVLSRVTPPTVGRIEVRGTVGTLLEVGTGFHNELTGRENIFLSGAILGMRRADIARRFDEIVAFADVDRFVDTPVKRYSSGMYLRLAFAVAAHLEPRILLVDEVLAVGDAAFQQKCIGRMNDVAGEGRTVLFVSHDVDAVQRLCADCIWLEQGRVAAYGGTAAVVRDYLSRVSGSVRARDWIDLRGRPRSGSGESRFTAARVLPVPGGLDGQPYPDGPLELVLEIESDAPRTIGSLAVSVESLTGAKLIEADILTIGQSVQLARGLTRVQFRIPSLHLNPGVYAIRLWLGHTATSGFDHLPVAFQLEVIRPTTMSTAQLPVTAGAVSCRFDVSAA